MGFFSKLFGRSDETDDQRELRDYNNDNAQTQSVQTLSPVTEGESRFLIGDVFTISGRGTVVTGRVAVGAFSVGDLVKVNGIQSRIRGLEQFRKMCTIVRQGASAGMILEGIEKNQVKSGDIIIK